MSKILKCEVNEAEQTLTLVLPWDDKGEVSSSGKSLVHATTKGNQAVAIQDGRQIKVGVNVYAPK